MNYGIDCLMKYEEKETTPAMESYKTMKATWDNFDKISRSYTDKIDVEANLNKVIQLEIEYLDKINEMYTTVEQDKYSVIDKIMKKYIPNIITVVGCTLAVLGISKLEAAGDDGAKEIMKDLGLLSGGAGIILKLKNSNVNRFKEDCLDALSKIKNVVKRDILINQKLISVGITNKSEASKCEIKFGKNGIIELYRRY